MENRDILQSFTDILQKKPNVNSLTTQLLNCVRNGKSKVLKSIFSKPDYHSRTRLITGSDISFVHVMFQFMLTQIAWAAIEGGMNELTAAAVYLDYRKKAAEVDSGQELQNLLQESLVKYTDMVAVLQNKKLPPLAQRCNEYISGHLYEPVNVNGIAKKLRVSRSYLSRLYKAACGETIIERIHKEKITAAEMLLVYSQFSLVDIAMELGFSSQSHFSQVFGKEKGMTPYQYRAIKKAQI
jgi:AraC-like DNA-binding protein